MRSLSCSLSFMRAFDQSCRNPKPQEKQPINHQEDQRSYTEVEPDRLVKLRRNHELHAVALQIPDSVVVAGDHLKDILPRLQVHIECLPSAGNILPVRVNSGKAGIESESFRAPQSSSRRSRSPARE